MQTLELKLEKLDRDRSNGEAKQNRPAFAKRAADGPGSSQRTTIGLRAAFVGLLALALVGRAPGQIAGTVDPTFSATLNSFPDVRAVALQKDGKVIVGGLFSTVNGVQRQNLARLNTD